MSFLRSVKRVSISVVLSLSRYLTLLVDDLRRKDALLINPTTNPSILIIFSSVYLYPSFI
jgi:hypothetical protein